MTDRTLEGKTALVTGASGGVGLRVAEKLAARGAHVVINSRSQRNADAALESLRGISAKVDCAIGDCGDHAAAVEVVAKAATLGGGLDIVVSAGAAGRVAPKPFAEFTGAELVDAFASRMFPRIFPIHAALPHLRQRGGGSVVMLCTDAARHPTPGESIVGAVGAGVILMTKSLARELAGWRIRVNSVSMTLTTDTPSWDRIFAGDAEFQEKLFSKLSQRFPWGRPPSAEEVARVAVFLATEESAQVTGQTVSANGGLSFGGW